MKGTAPPMPGEGLFYANQVEYVLVAVKKRSEASRRIKSMNHDKIIVHKGKHGIPVGSFESTPTKA